MSKDTKDRIVHLQPPVIEEDVPNVYANSVGMTMGVYDFILQFGQVTDPKDGPRINAVVQMSPQHAKVFGMVLLKNLKKYEKDIGKINLPSAMIKELGIENEVF